MTNNKNVYSLAKAKKAKDKKDKLKKEYEEAISVEDQISKMVSDSVKTVVDEVFVGYEELANDYKELFDDYKKLADLLDRVAHTSNKGSYKEMLLIDFLDLKNANDGQTYEEFKNYIGIVEKRPQIKGDDAFTGAIKDIKAFHLEDDFLMNEYHNDMERDDGLDIFTCKNDFKKINQTLVDSRKEVIN